MRSRCRARSPGLGLRLPVRALAAVELPRHLRRRAGRDRCRLGGHPGRRRWRNASRNSLSSRPASGCRSGSGAPSASGCASPRSSPPWPPRWAPEPRLWWRRPPSSAAPAARRRRRRRQCARALAGRSRLRTTGRRRRRALQHRRRRCDDARMRLASVASAPTARRQIQRGRWREARPAVCGGAAEERLRPSRRTEARLRFRARSSSASGDGGPPALSRPVLRQLSVGVGETLRVRAVAPTGGAAEAWVWPRHLGAPRTRRPPGAAAG